MNNLTSHRPRPYVSGANRVVNILGNHVLIDCNCAYYNSMETIDITGHRNVSINCFF